MQVVDFVVHGNSSDDAVRTARAILAGHGFSVAGTPAGLVVATRGNRMLTVALGAFVPADRHWQRLILERVGPDPVGTAPGRHTVTLRLRAHHGGAAVAAGSVQRSRTSSVFRQVADRIATTLIAGGQLVARHDQH
ncbi:hypothetical protein [Curtobacterium sp. Leaf261]|uniref:hypothetical protein n=1 Tax=Curtobacterium sp. Leaf261 TaxID=1736311 RepID=UPI0006FAA669|nr:hypothetical protein [Curtobacterium sp. Leaf261]KQO62302.1 hypothetical protein ASF23_10910 [Curtobacterium sp. Leaf261]